MNDVFFTSDQHYGHAKIIEHCKRPFASVEQMNEFMIMRHNNKVPRGARVYHLGDFAYKATREEVHAILKRLNGQHYLIRGNHDETQEWMQEHYPADKKPFVWVRDIAYFPVGSQKLMLCHYPMRSWRSSGRGSWHLFGHEHGRFPRQGNSFDVGVDCWNFEPLSFEEVAARMEKYER